MMKRLLVHRPELSAARVLRHSCARGLSGVAAPAAAAGDDVKDVLIVGAGVVGSVLAARLARGSAGRAPLSVAVIEPRSPPAMEVAARAAEPDVRVFAITPASMRALESCGVADGILSSGRVSSYDRMQVWDALGPGHICFSTDDGAAVPQPLHALARSLESAATAALRGSASEPDASRLRRERRAVGASESDSGSSGRTVPAQLGYIAENGLLNGALFDELQRLDAAGRLQLLCPGKVKSIRAPPAGTTAGMLPSIRAGTGSSGPSSPSPSPAPAPSPDQLASVTLDDGRVIRARLLVAADGAMSAVRGAAGIATWGWGYDQTAVVATVRTEEAHTTAWQRFLPHGPVAVLPLWDGMSSIVWSTSPDHAAALLAMQPHEFAAALNTVLHAPTDAFAAALTGSDPESAAAEASAAAAPSSAGAASSSGAADAEAEAQRAYESSLFVPSRDRIFLDPLWAMQRAAHAATGALTRATAAAGMSPPFMTPPRIASTVGGRASFPLRFQSANRYIAPRVALVGDAAHSVHPLAGQGLNLGIADAVALSDVLLEAAESGGDIGSLRTLRAYEQRTLPRNLGMMAGIDALKRTFDWQLDPSVLTPLELPATQKNALWAPVIAARAAGLAVLNAMPPAKALLARIAMGL